MKKADIQWIDHPDATSVTMVIPPGSTSIQTLVIQPGTLKIGIRPELAPPHHQVTQCRTKNGDVDLVIAGWPVMIGYTVKEADKAGLIVQGGRAIEPEFTSGAVGPEAEREMIPVWTPEPTTPAAAQFERLPPRTQAQILLSLSQILPIAKEIQIDGQPIDMQAVRNAASLARIERGGFWSTPTLTERNVETLMNRLIQQRGEQLGREEGLRMVQGEVRGDL